MSGPTLTTFQGQPALALRAADGARATILLHGAHLVSWVPAGGEEQLYVSPTARYGAGASIRGGVPVIFPQFNARGPLPRHGLARSRSWEAVESTRRGDLAIAVLRLTDTDETRAIWPQGFEAEMTFVVAGGNLEMELAVTNTGDTPFTFTAALHTYLRCNDALKVQLEGLQHHEFEDALAGGEIKQQWGDVLTLAGEIDRVYHAVENPLTLRELGRRLNIAARDFDDVVVWNPGPEGAARLADMPDDDWQQMLCVEAARIANPVTLAPGGEWAGMQALSV